MYSALKKVYIVAYKFLFNFCYQLGNKLKKHQDEKAVFVLSRTNTLQGNLKYIHEELKRQLPKVKIHLIRTENRMNFNLFKELKTINNAQYLILDDYYLPVYLIKPSKRLKVIQLWHAAGAFKKFGHSTIGTKFGPSKDYLKLIPIHSNYTHVYVSSKNTIPYYAEAFNMSQENIYNLGIPRIDMFHDDVLKKCIKGKIYESYPILKNSKNIIVLMAPTYRASGAHEETNFDFIRSLKNILSEVSEEVLIILKPHPYMSEEQLNLLGNHSNIIIDNKYFLNDWMLISDAFITDYSSAIFDFSILKRPIAHFVPDIYYYEKNRGFYEKINLISVGDILVSEDELINWIDEREKNECFDTTKMIKYNFDQTKGISEKIVQHFIEN